MERTVIPLVNDVLFGRGQHAINTHPGNRQFQSLLDSHKDNFIKAQNNRDKNEKRSIALLIFTAIQSMQPPGRFLVEGRQIRNATELSTDNNDESASLSSSDIHPILKKKYWKCVDPEMALVKILKRLHELDIEEMEFPLPRTQIGMVESGGIHSHSNMLPKPQPLEVKIGDKCQFNDYSHNRWGNQIVGDAVRLLSQLNHQRLHSNSNSLHLNASATSADEALISEASSIRDGADGAATETKSKNGNASCQYLEGSGLDFIDDSLLQVKTPQVEQNLSEYTLQQWIMASNPVISFDTATSMPSPSKRTQYIMSTLPIALKLTECLIEAEKDEQNGLTNPIPLASIAPDNVLIRAKVEGEIEPPNDAHETIEFAWFMSFVGDDLATGGVMARLLALGKVLYELFSSKELIMDIPTMVSMHSIDLRNDIKSSDQCSQKKCHWRPNQAGDDISMDIFASLAADGVPWSLCALVKNLLECRHGAFCADDAYASLADLQADLQLMLDHPACYLDNLHFSDAPKLEVYDKLYGREDEVKKLDALYKRHITEKDINGTIISGGPGFGKSKLAMHMQKLTSQHDGYFLSTKFEQNQNDVKPLSTISKLFNSLCEMLLHDSYPSELKAIEEELTDAIGSQSILLEVLPSLKKLMPSSARLESLACNFVDSALNMMYQLGEFVRVISSHSKPITILIDDLQFADDASLRLVGNLFPNAQRASMFFVICHRDDDDSLNDSLNAWLASISLFSLESIQLESMPPEGIENLISETLHLSPRITRPLSSVLHRKTSGNPLFLRQLLNSLTEQGYIYVDLVQRRWAWDINKIIEMEISDSVVAFLMKQVRRLPSDMQLGLQVASCIGTCVTESMLAYLSADLGHDLNKILWQVCQGGFMIDVADASLFRFAHDKIQEAVYEMMPEQQRRENHMRFGLCLCIKTFDDRFDNEELFFVAVNQINQGGPAAVQEPSQKCIIAELNLKAGRRSIQLSDHNTAVKFFQHGISFLGDGKWTSNYQLSLDLYDAATHGAFVLGQIDMVRLLSDEVLLHARCFEDKLYNMCTVARFISTRQPEEGMESSFRILLECNEVLPRTMGDKKLKSDIDHMNYIVQQMSDDSIYNMKEDYDKKRNSILLLYAHLSHFMQYFKPWLLGSVSLRMVELTMNHGRSAQSPLAFAYFGGILVSLGYVNEGCRLGKLALKLVDQSLPHKSIVICVVYDTVFWAFEPLQSIVNGHHLGHKAGQQSGNVVSALKNLMLSITLSYFVGQSLDEVLQSLRGFIIQIRDHKIFLANAVLLLLQIMVLRDGPDATCVDDGLPSENDILLDARSGPTILAYGKVHRLTRAFHFRHMLDATLNIGISEAVAESSHLLKTDFIVGYFFEGLASFQLARINKSANWIERGHSVLERLRLWSEYSSWNWANKLLLLEAENKYTEGDFVLAESLYDSAIRSAHEHKFIHEEAIACELAGTFYYERGFHQVSYPFFLHSIKSYNQWGAFAVARRVESFVQDNFRNIDIYQLVLAGSSAGTSLEYLFASSQGSKRRSQGDG